MNTLTAEEFAVFNLALDLLFRQTDEELSKARRQSNNAKQMAMITMRTQIVNARAKLVMLRGDS